MIELSEPLQTAVEQQAEPVEVIDPRTQVHYLVVRAEYFHHLEKLAYDDSPWTESETALLASEAGRSLGWDAMDEYDRYDEVKR